ncbi:hypothetical protein BJF89_17595 [Corynebacterium sp. CNJ-954]|uniref:hypothetical protein n=1 Tax=Corynebacterium sp. CNJ-954 TaxID=1904962 RepID=UPI000963F02F|nr:hypothetical protein [Corynebacterium sp. CNJ-954]OLT53439.1 hypothetical protein BJF89_17595 [Corynebacterium sp. CNJ-954]
MVDTKQSKTAGEYHVAAELARRDWAPALTRDGLARTDILAVNTVRPDRRQIEIQVKASRGPVTKNTSWALGLKDQGPSAHEREYYVLVALPDDLLAPPRNFIVPRVHLSAATFISHRDWLTEPGIEPGIRNAGHDRARVKLPVFAAYEDRWDLLNYDQSQVPVLLPHHYQALATDPRVGLPAGHEWNHHFPEWC